MMDSPTAIHPDLESQQADLFGGAWDAWQSAVANAVPRRHCFEIAGTNLRVHFAGPAMESKLAPGLANPVSELGSHPTCDVYVWDAESTGVTLPPPARELEDFTGRGNIWGYDSSRYRSAYHWGEGAVSLMDLESRRAMYWLNSHRDLPAWVLGSPLRTILHWWLESNGRQLVHAAGLGYRGRGVLIPGRGGSGKSSTALACLEAGLDYIGDDYLAIAMDPEPVMYRLFNTAKLEPAQMARFPGLARCRSVLDPGFDKSVLFLDTAYAGQLRTSLPLSRILKPSISGRPETTFSDVSALDVELGMSSETLAHLPHVGGHTVAFLERISKQVPRAEIHLGTDRPQIVREIRQHLEQPAPAPAAEPATSITQPTVSVSVHLRQDDPTPLKELARHLDAQNYPRIELVVVADGSAPRLTSALPAILKNSRASIRLFPVGQTVSKCIAWNRAVREAFADLLLFLEPGDRFRPQALETLVRQIHEHPSADLIRSGARLATSFAGNDERLLAGVLIHKQLFRTLGLFDRTKTGSNAERDWLIRAEASSRTAMDRTLESQVLIEAAPPAQTNLRPPLTLADLRKLKRMLDQRKQAESAKGRLAKERG